MNSKKEKKTIVGLVVSIIALLMFTVGMTFAYFTASSSATSSTMTFGTLAVDIDSYSVSSQNCHTPIVPCCVLDVAGTIETTSTIDSLVRIKPSVTVTPAQNSTLVSETAASQLLGILVASFESEDNGNWLRKTENNVATGEYLYYVNKLAPNGTASLDGVKIRIPTSLGNEWQGATFTVTILVEAIQAEHVGVDLTGNAQAKVNSMASATNAVSAWAQIATESNNNASEPAYIRGTYENNVFEADPAGDYIMMGKFGTETDNLVWRDVAIESYGGETYHLLVCENVIRPSEVITEAYGVYDGAFNRNMYYTDFSGEYGKRTIGQYTKINYNNYYFSNARAYLNSLNATSYIGQGFNYTGTTNSNESVKGFTTCFTEEQLELIKLVKPYNTPANGVNWGYAKDVKSTLANIGEDGTDYFFLLSSYDIYGVNSSGNALSTTDSSNGYDSLVDKTNLNSSRIRKDLSNSAKTWWLRSPGSYAYYEREVTGTGTLNQQYPDWDGGYGFLPAMFIKL